MLFVGFKIAVASITIALASWLSAKRPDLAGFIMALPMATMLALLLSHAEYRDSATSVAFAKSIFYAIPVSLLFFVPFLFADRLSLSFWQCFASGVVLLIVGYFLHRAIFAALA